MRYPPGALLGSMIESNIDLRHAAVRWWNGDLRATNCILHRRLFQPCSRGASFSLQKALSETKVIVISAELITSELLYDIIGCLYSPRHGYYLMYGLPNSTDRILKCSRLSAFTLVLKTLPFAIATELVYLFS